MTEYKTFREKRRQHDLKLIEAGELFNNDMGKKPYLMRDKKNPNGIWRPKADLLMSSKNNLFPQISDEVILFFLSIILVKEHELLNRNRIYIIQLAIFVIENQYL